MYTIHLSTKQLKRVKQLQENEKSVKVYRRLQTLIMASEGQAYQAIASTLAVSVNTVTDWLKLYKKSGLTGLRTLHFTGKRQSSFDKYATRIKQDIKDNVIPTLAALQAWVKKKYSLELEQSWLFRCCKKNSIYLTKRPV